MIVAAIFAVTVLGWGQGQAPSFDCRRARSDAERMICADSRLARLDANLARAYVAALARLNPAQRRVLVQDQRQFLRVRDDTFQEIDLRYAVRSPEQRLRDRLNQVAAFRSTGEWEGIWENVNGTVEIRRLGQGRLAVDIQTHEPRKGNWICDAKFEARRTARGLEGEPVGDTDWTVVLERTDGVLSVRHNQRRGALAYWPDYCGHAGTLEGEFLPTTVR